MPPRGASKCAAWGPRDGMKRVRECVYGGELDLQTLIERKGLSADHARRPTQMPAVRIASRARGVHGAALNATDASVIKPQGNTDA